jgi:hypothetical protein
VVLDALLGMQGIGSDLTAEIDLALLAAGGVEGHLALLARMIVETPAQDLQGGGAILVLRSLVLALHDDLGRKVRDADGGVRLVHVLPAGAARAVGIDAQVLFLDLDFDVIVDLGEHRDAREGGVAPRLGVEGRDPHQAVHPLLGVQVAVGVLARHRERGAAQPGLVAGLDVEHFGLVAAPRRPAQVHPHQHLGPVTGVRATGARVDGYDGVRGVLLAAEHPPELRIGELGVGFRELLGDLAAGLGVVGLDRQLEQDVGVLEAPRDAIVRLDVALDAALLAQDLLGLFAVFPQVGTRGLLLQRPEASAKAVEVKDAPGTRRAARAARAAAP